MKKLLLASALLLLVLVFPQSKVSAQAASCGSQGGTCRTSCSSSEQQVSSSDCVPGPRAPQFCCAPRSQVTPVACTGTCRPSCLSGEVQFRNVNTCEASGQVCCNINPLTTQEPGSTEVLDGPTCDGGNGVNTAIGCIPFNDTSTFISFILRWAIGVGGGIAFLLIIYAAFMIMSSQGNPERIKAGQELLNSAIAGLILLIFS